MAKDRNVPLGLGLLGGNAKVYNTIAELKQDRKIKTGKVVEVLGYYQAGDGANHKRIIADNDDGSGVQLDSGLWANCSVEVKNRGYIDIRWFGAKSDFDFDTKTGTDVSLILKKCIDYSNTMASTPIAIIGNFYIGTPIVTNGQLHMFGYSTPSRMLITNETGYNIKRKPISSIWVKSGITAITLDGTGQVTDTKVKDTHLYCEKINLFSEGLTSTFIRCTTFGAPSRPGYFKTIEATGFNNVLLFDFYDEASVNGTNYYNFQIDDGCNMYGNNYVINTIGRDNTPPSIGGLSIANSTLEQGARFKLKNMFGYNEIKNCLLEGQDNVFDLGCQSDISTISINGNYFEANSGECNIGGCSLEMKNNYYLSSDFKFNLYSANIKELDLDIQYLKKVVFSNYTAEIYNKTLKMLSLDKMLGSPYSNVLLGSVPYGLLKIDDNPTITNGVLFEGNTANSVINNVKLYDAPDVFSPIYSGGYKQLNLNPGDYIALTFFKTTGLIDLGLFGTGASGIGYSPTKSFFYEGIHTVVFQLTSSDTTEIIVYGKKYDETTKISSMSVRKFTAEELAQTQLKDIITIYQTPIQESVTTETLNTPLMLYAMEQEGGTIKEDYLNYSLQKMQYDKQVQEKEQAKYKAYELLLQDNPNLTWEEFESTYSTPQPMMRARSLSVTPELKEPEIPESVQKFMEKYLGTTPKAETLKTFSFDEVDKLNDTLKKL